MAKPTLIEELKRSMVVTDELTSKLSIPTTKWGKAVLMLQKFEIAVEDMKERKVITPRQEAELRKEIAPLSYWTILNSPDLHDCPKIARKVKLELMNVHLKRLGFRNIQIEMVARCKKCGKESGA